MKAPPASFALRPARPEDAPAIQQLVHGILAEYGLPADPEGADADLVAPANYYPEHGGVFWVLLDGRKIIATLGMLPLRHRVVEMRKMYLASAYRGTGQGKRLLDHAIEWARERGFRQIRLETASVLTEAIALYRKNGFIDLSETIHTARSDRVMGLDLLDPA